jgi:hypothetical protein
MKVEKQIRKVEVEEPVYILEMSELDICRIRELLGNITNETFNDIMEEDPNSWQYKLSKDKDNWLYETYKSLEKVTKQ